MGKNRARNRKDRISGLVVLIDSTTYVDACENPTQCVIMVIAKEEGDELWRLPRIHMPDRIVQAGPQTMAEYVRAEMSGRIGFAITDELTFAEEIGESDRSFLVFTGPVQYYVATDSIYAAVAAKNLQELRFFRDHFSRFHHEIAQKFLKE